MKLKRAGISEGNAEEAIADLISSGFLNDERFAKAFAGGKFRMKQWGKQKIVAELRKHKISDRVIQTALSGLESDDYTAAVRKLAERKLATIMNPDRRARYYTVARYLAGKGFEGDLVRAELNQLLGEIEEHEFRT